MKKTPKKLRERQNITQNVPGKQNLGKQLRRSDLMQTIANPTEI